MRAYLGKPEIKTHYVSLALEHELADAYVKGLYWQEQEKKGCNIGCWSRDAQGGHARLALDMGLPEALLHLSDGLFEALPDPDFKTWSRRFAEAVPVGADLSPLPMQLLTWMLSDPRWGLCRLAEWPDHIQFCLTMGAHFGSLSEGRPVAPSFEAGVQALADGISQSLASWHAWDMSATRNFRASRAALEVWKARDNGVLALSRAAWACRAAWSADPWYARAQASATVRLLGEFSAQPSMSAQ